MHVIEVNERTKLRHSFKRIPTHHFWEIIIYLNYIRKLSKFNTFGGQAPIETSSMYPSTDNEIKNRITSTTSNSQKPQRYSEFKRYYSEKYE